MFWMLDGMVAMWLVPAQPPWSIFRRFGPSSVRAHTPQSTLTLHPRPPPGRGRGVQNTLTHRADAQRLAYVRCTVPVRLWVWLYICLEYMCT